MSFPLVLFSEETSSTAASACYANWPLHCDRPLSLARQFASLSTGRLSRSLFFCLSQLACLCGHPSVYLPVYRHVCDVCTHFCPPRYLSPWQPNAVFLPWFGADPGETLRRLIWGLADVRLIAFQCRSFWQWYWWMGLQKTPAWNVIISCWCYEVLMSSIYPSIRTYLCRSNLNISSIVYMYLCEHTFTYNNIVSLCEYVHN